MRTMHDDLPHPVPPVAYVRWKENYFFVILCHEQNVFGIGHINNEPGFERSRFACALSVNGKQYTYKNECAIPDDFGASPEIGDGRMTMKVVKSHEELHLKVDGDDFMLDARFSARMPSFEFGACRYGAPENLSFKEVMTFGTNLPYEHMQQAMTIGGTLTLREGGKEIALDGYGYRDHSWGMRTDNAVAWHTWSGLNFPGKAFGIMDLEMLGRPGVAREGYVADEEGVRVLRKIEIRKENIQADGLPAKVIWDVTDVFGKRYVMEADIAGRFGEVRHENEKASKPSGKTGYSMMETFCSIRLDGSDERGVGLVEIGESAVKR
ncbi:hypothetical protein SAMN02927924_02993 [Sphingobium faniae]|nr:hypothetical protein SAMN02927924_02993 [Sphingobium faniae]